MISADGKYLKNGDNCDTALFINLSACDLYVTLSIDGVEFIRTPISITYYGRESTVDKADFHKSYTTGKRHENTFVTIELKDADDNEDDSLGSVTERIGNMLGVKTHHLPHGNKVTIISHWLPEYADDF